MSITPDTLRPIARILVLVSLTGTGFADENGWVPSNEKPPCECKDNEALAVDLANAVRLSKAYAQESQILRKQYGANEIDKSIDAEGSFTKNTAPNLVQTVPGLTGEVATTFEPEGTTTGTGQPIPAERKCDPNERSKDDLQRDVDNSVCKEMAEADIAHEKSHWDQCRLAGFNKYWYGTTGAARALEESRAYEAEATVLTKQLEKSCDDCKPRMGCDKPPCRLAPVPSSMWSAPQWCTKSALNGNYSKP